MDFSKMNGYEFEDYITALLKSMGFKTSQTGYSNDGGIDIIAEYDKPIFKGKYIVQCKNYTGLVGQPEIRDLYGVVMSENANKGIIITPSDFTEQAYDFAKNKNLELIYGSILSSIIAQNGSNADSDSIPAAVTYTGFNYDQYNYINDRIKENPKDKGNYLDMLRMLWDYVIDDADFLIPLKLFNQIVDYNLQMIKKCYRKNESKTERYIDIALIYILTGNLGEATSIMLDNGCFYITHLVATSTVISQNRRYIRDLVVPGCKKTWNLHTAYKMIGFYQGCEEIQKKMVKPIDDNSFTLMHKGLLPLAEKLFDSFINGEYDDSFFVSVNRESRHYVSFDFEENRPNIFPNTVIIPLSNYKKYYTKSNEEIRSDIVKAFRQHGIEITSEENGASDELMGF